MPRTETETLLNQVGQLLVEATNYTSASTLLYARVDTNMVSANLFVERGNHVEYVSSGSALTYPLLDLWEEEQSGKRWTEMQYLLRSGKFTVAFTYPDEIDPDEDFDALFDRRDRIVKHYFGEKPIVYPPMPGDGGEHFHR